MENKIDIVERYRNAKRLAREASPATLDEAISNLCDMVNQFKWYYENARSYVDKAKARNVYENINIVIQIMRNQGYCSPVVGAFFGLILGNTPSFFDLARGRRITDLPLEILNGGALASTPASSGASAVGGGNNSASAGATSAPVTGGVDGLADNAKDEPAKNAPVSSMKFPDIPVASLSGSPKNGDPGLTAKRDVPTDGANTDSPADAPGAQPADNANGDMNALDSLAPQCLDDFIGQIKAVKRLKEAIAVAKMKGSKHLDNILLFGRPGLGKTTLMFLIAKELGVRFEFMDCSSFMNDVKSHRKIREFFIRISKSNEPTVIALDEIHCLPGQLQSNLLTLLESRFYSDMNDSGETVQYPMPEFTFIGATTDYDAVLQTIKDRSQLLTLHLVDYTREELRKIFAAKFAVCGYKSVADDVIDACINRCRSSMRTVSTITKGLCNKAIIANADTITMDMVNDCFDDLNVDAIGLTEIERRILKVLAEAGGTPMSADTLAAKVGIQDTKILLKEHEPYLLKIGFISIIARGRSLTNKAVDYIERGYYDFGDGFVIGADPTPPADPAPSSGTDPDAGATPPADPTPTADADPTPAEDPVLPIDINAVLPVLPTTGEDPDGTLPVTVSADQHLPVSPDDAGAAAANTVKA